MAFYKQQDEDGNQVFLADGGGSEEAETIVEFADGVTAAIGRGSTDTDITYIRLNRADGSDIYLYVSSGTTITASTTKP